MKGLPVLLLIQKVEVEGRCQDQLPMNYSDPKGLASKIFFEATTFMKKIRIEILEINPKNIWGGGYAPTWSKMAKLGEVPIIGLGFC